MKFTLVYDDEKELVFLSDCIMEFLGNNATISCFRSDEKILKTWMCSDYDLIILDIYMDKLLGIERSSQPGCSFQRQKIFFRSTRFSAPAPRVVCILNK